MKETDYLQAYLHLLVRADAVITTDSPRQISYNDELSPGNFKNKLLYNEIMITRQMADIMESIQHDKTIAGMVDLHLKKLKSLFRVEPGQEPGHRYLQIIKDGKLSEYKSIGPSLRKLIAVYVGLQYESLKNTAALLTSGSFCMSDDYRMLLGPTEFIEFAMILQASGRMLPEAGPGSQIGLARYLARVLRVDFPANYHTLKTQLYARDHLCVFFDYLRNRYVSFLREKEK